MSDSAAKALALAALAYKGEHASGNYTDIANKPKLNNITILGNHNSNYYKLPLLAETGHSVSFDLDSEFNLTLKLLNKAGEEISSASVDLPIESLIMGGHYREDSEGKWLVLVLQNGNEIEIPLEDLIDELATKEYVDSLYQDVLIRIDSEAQLREEEDIILNARIDSEAAIRKENDDILADLYVGLFEQHMEDTSELKNLIDSEAITRENRFIELQSQLNSEIDLRDEQYIELCYLIDSEGRTREEEFRLFREDFNNEVAARIAGDSELRADLNMEIFHRTQGDLDLQAKLDSEAVLRANKDTQLENLLGQEAATRSSQDIALSNRIDQKQDILSASTPLIKLGSTLQLNYDPNTLKVEDNALKVIGGGGGGASYLNGVLLDSEATTESTNIICWLSNSEYEALGSELNPETVYMVYDAGGDPITQVASYNRLEDLPKINGVTLSGDKTLSSFGIQPTLTFGRGLRTDSEGHIHVNVREGGVLGIDTSNRLYVDSYTRAQVDQMVASIFNTSCVATLPETPTRNTIYFVGTQNPYITILFDSNGQEHYLGYFNLNAGIPTPTPPQTGQYKCELISTDGVLSWNYTAI